MNKEIGPEVDTVIEIEEEDCDILVQGSVPYKKVKENSQKSSSKKKSEVLEELDEKKKSKSKETSSKNKKNNKGEEGDDKKLSKKNKKHEKAKDKEQKKQLQLEMMIEPKEPKESVKLKYTQKAENERQMAEFSRRYPQYVSSGKFVFPIEDKIFLTFESLLAEHIPKNERPKPKSGFIPPQALGDVLQIWNFFNTFAELFKCEDIKKEEIYACLTYKGTESLGLINDMHQGIMSLFLQEYIKKGKFETFKDRTDNPFFVLLKSQVEKKDLDGDELALIWTEFARKMITLQPCNELFSETTKRIFELLGKSGSLGYNNLEYRHKIKILINLIEALNETDNFKEFISERMDAIEKLIKERSDLQQEIKHEEQTLKDQKAKLSQKGKETKGTQQLQNEVDQMEALIEQKKERIAEMNSELFMPLQSAYFVGTDVHKSEYWVFQAEPTKLYVRYPEIVSTEEEWYFYDTKSEFDQLLKSLNPKGIKEKNLLESLEEFITNGKLVMKQDMMEADKENIPPRKRKEENRRDSKDKMEEDDQVESSYWIAKVMEYDEVQNDSNSRTTRRKQQLEQQSRGGLFQKKTPKNLNLDTIKAMLLDTEERLNIYVAKWDSWWALPKVREAVLNQILEVQEIPEFRNLLLDLNEHWKYGISYREKKTQSLADTNSTEDRSKLSEEGKEEESEDEKSEEEEEEVENESSRSKGVKDEGVTSGQTMEIEELETRKTKKYPMRFWGMYTDKLKSSWINYTTTVDTLDGVFYSAMMLCNAINTYVERMTVRYFTHYKTGKEYMAARWKPKTQVEESPAPREKRAVKTRSYRDIENSDSEPEPESEPQRRGKSRDIYMKIENLDNYKHAKKKVVHNKVIKENQSEGKSTAESDTFTGRLRNRDRSQTPSEERYTLRSQKPKGNMSKLEEIANVRKSSRLSKASRETINNEISEEERILEDSIEEVRPARRSARRIS